MPPPMVLALPSWTPCLRLAASSRASSFSLCENLQKGFVGLRAAFKGFVVIGMHDRPSEVGVSGFFRAASVVRDHAAARRENLANRHEGLSNVDPSGIELQSGFANKVLRLQHHARFDFRRIADRGHGREELFDQWENANPHPGRVDTDVFDVVALCHFFNGLGLLFKAEVAPLETLQDTERAALYRRRRDDDTAGAVAG